MEVITAQHNCLNKAVKAFDLEMHFLFSQCSRVRNGKLA